MPVDTIRQKMADAEALQNQGKHSEAIGILSEVVSESTRIYDRLTAARLIVSIHIYSSPNLPRPGTEKYIEIHNFLRIAIDSYDSATPRDKNTFVRSGNDIGGLRKLLDTMERGEPLENPKPLQNPGRKRICFIATAVYGSSETAEVLVFQQFRDEVLLSSYLGKISIEIYYFLSPPVARLISKSNVLRIAIRYFVLNPLLRLLKRLQRT